MAEDDTGSDHDDDGADDTDEARRPDGDARTALLEAYGELRVADVVDALDFPGIHDACRVDDSVGPLWRDESTFDRRLTGLAYTATEPRDLPRPAERDFETVTGWAWDWWDERSPDPDVDRMRDGDVLVLAAHDMDVGIMGSFNLLTVLDAGARGLVTDGGPRDTDSPRYAYWRVTGTPAQWRSATSTRSCAAARCPRNTPGARAG